MLAFRPPQITSPLLQLHSQRQRTKPIIDRNARFEEQILDAMLPWLQEDLGSYWNLGRSIRSATFPGQPISTSGGEFPEDPDLDIWNPVSLDVTPFFDPTGPQAWMQIPPSVPATIPEQNLLAQRRLLPDFNNLDWNFDFPVEFDVSAEPAAATATSKPFNCTFQGCNSKSFMRKYDLERHMKKHNRAQVFPCSVGSRPFSQHSRAFYRQDKLQSHLKNAHPGYQAASTGDSAAGAIMTGPTGNSG